MGKVGRKGDRGGGGIGWGRGGDGVGSARGEI